MRSFRNLRTALFHQVQGISHGHLAICVPAASLREQRPPNSEAAPLQVRPETDQTEIAKTVSAVSVVRTTPSFHESFDRDNQESILFAPT
jgi:hypothetical protein